MENSINKEFISFKLCAILNSVMKFCTLTLSPTLDMNHTFIHILAVETTHPLVT